MQAATIATYPQPPALRVGAAGYHSYLVRVWQTHPQSAWRASAQCVQTGATILFADLPTLYAFLSSQTRESLLEGQE